MKKTLLKIGTVALTIIFVGFSGTQVAAQSKPALDLLVFPPTAYLNVKPGKTLAHHVLLQYNGTQALQLTAEVHDFVPDGKTGVPVIQDNSSFATVALINPDLKLGQPFIIHPNTKLDLALAITPDSNLVEKEYLLALVLKAEPLPDRVGTQNGGVTAGAIVSNMIIVVANDGANHGKIEMKDFPMTRFVDSFGHIEVNALAENTGTTATAPKGTITLHDWRGNKVGNWFIYPDVILAKSTRLVRAMVTDPVQLKEGDRPKLVAMSYDAPFLLGPYTVTTQLENLDGTTEQHTVTVFALPFSIIVAILVGVALYGVYLYTVRRLNNKRW